MTPEEQQKKTELEQQINEEFSQLQQNLWNLKKSIQFETDVTKKEEQNKRIKEMEAELSEINVWKERLTSLQEQELLSLKTRLESLKNAIQSFKWEVVDLQEEIRESADKQNEKSATPTTYELLKDSETYNRLLNIISSNPSKFKKLKKDEEGNELDTPEKKLEYIFRKIRESIVQFMENKLWKSEITKKVIDNTIAPAFERSLMELLRENWNETNVSMLKRIDNISFDSFKKLLSWVWNFAKKATWSYTKFSQWINAIDYLSVHNGVLREPNHSKVLTSLLEFQKYMNNEVFAPKDEKWDIVAFSPYSKIEGNIFQIDNDQTFEFGISRKKRRDQPQGQKSEEEKSDEEIILERIWNIQVVNNPRTTSLIVEMLNKPAEFFKATSWLQETANGLLDWIDSLNSATKMFGVDILWEITKIPEKRGFLFKIMDFVCKLIWITWWLEWIVKKWRMDKMNLTNEKNDNISKIFEQYKDNAWENKPLNITDENSCKTALNDFAVTDPQNSSSTKWDFLRDSIAENMDVSLVSPTVIQAAIDGQILWNSLDYYLKKENTENWKEKTTVDGSKFTSDDKLKLAHSHLISMKTHLENYKDNDLSDFYANIHSTEDLALCISASLYVNPNDVIEWVKAKVFLPENYGVIRSDGTVEDNWWKGGLDTWVDKSDKWKQNLDAWVDKFDKQEVSEQWMYDKIVEYWITDKRQIAYVLATVKWETNKSGVWFRNIEEIWKWKEKEYWKIDPETKKAYYGRWFVQLTWKKNYQKYTEIIKSRELNFKDNEGNILKYSDIDLVKDPDLILKSNELAAFILVHWMKNWSFTWRKLDDFIKDWKTNYVAARGVVNWSDRAKEFANYANTYLNKITNDNSLA